MENKLKVIYEPRGRAREYSALAVNLYNGCGHGCLYCYAPDCMFADRKKFHAEPKIRVGGLEKLKDDCGKLQHLGEKVMLSFTSDPYQQIEEELLITRKALEMFREYNIPFQVLTKGGNRAARDFVLYSDKDAFATTLTFISEVKSLHYEPGAALPKDRIETIKKAKQNGIETWVSFEPVLNDEEVLKLLEETHEFVDLYKVGKVSRFKPDKEIDWKRFANRIINRLEMLGKNYYIKNDLKMCM